MKFGYIRVSRDKQATALQVDAMNREQCEKTFTGKMTSKRFDRPEFVKMLEQARVRSSFCSREETCSEHAKE
jgi:DNA invertase Pin-like site-specific DNA recombinase